MDDMPLPANALHAVLVLSRRPHARLLRVDASKAVEVGCSPKPWKENCCALPPPRPSRLVAYDFNMPGSSCCCRECAAAPWTQAFQGAVSSVPSARRSSIHILCCIPMPQPDDMVGNFRPPQRTGREPYHDKPTPFIAQLSCITLCKS